MARSARFLGQSYLRRAKLNWQFGIMGSRWRAVAYAISAGLVLALFFLRLGLQPWLGSRSPLLPFIPAVVLAAGLYGVGPGLFAIILSALIATIAFIGPIENGSLDAEQVANIVVFLVVGGTMLWFANHLRAARNRADKLQAELLQSQSNAAMGTMAGTLAHELNQPLAAAANYVAACHQMSLSLNQNSEALTNGLVRAETQIQRAGEIIRQARGLVRKTPVDREPASIRRMSWRAIDVLKDGQFGRHVEFKVNVSKDADIVEVNPIQIEQVLINLLRNAGQAAMRTGTAEITLDATSTQSGILIEVRDFGPGIPHDRVHSLFSATKPSDNGLGMGLSISRTIIEAHGGSIWAQNNPAGGASFFVLLPNPPEEP